jgi:hypothetical protein
MIHVSKKRASVLYDALFIKRPQRQPAAEGQRGDHNAQQLSAISG